MLFVCWVFCCSAGYLYTIYPRKILVLLMMECLFLYSFFLYMSVSGSSCSYFFFPIFLLILFLVLDSVVGIVLMLSISRLHGAHSNWFF